MDEEEFSRGLKGFTDALADLARRLEEDMRPMPWILETYARHLQDRGRQARWPKGLCPDRGDHDPHSYVATGLGGLWCTARQEDREPGRSERVLRWQGSRQTLMTVDEIKGWSAPPQVPPPAADDR